MTKQRDTNNNDDASTERINDDETNDNLHNNSEKKIDDHLSIKSETTETTEMAEIVENPKHWPRRKKNMILFIVSLAGMFCPLSSTIFYPAVPKVQVDLNTSEVLSNGLIGTFIFFMGVAPLGWASYSDAFQTRRNVYLASFTIYIIGCIICAVSNNIWVLLVMRSIQSCGSSAVLSIGAGTIGDIFHSLERGRAYGIFYVGPLVGPVLGPVIGGYIADYLGWRWIFWILSMMGGLVVILIYFLLPETFAPSSELPTPNTTTSNSPHRKRFDPLSALFLLKYPNLSLAMVYISVLFAMIYVQNTLVPRDFENKYNLTTSTVGLVFLASGSGYMSGSVLGGKWSDFVMVQAKKRNNDVGYPEMRLHSVWIGIFFFSVSYICFGWFLEANLHMVFPIIVMFTGAFSAMTVFNSISTYFVDAFPNKSASAIAVNNLGRSLTAALFIFVSAPFEDAVGVGWVYTFMVFLSIIGIFCLILVCKKGKDWRERTESKIEG